VKERHGYTIGDRVLLNKPSQVGGHKIQTLWTGPAQILSRTGASSYIISTPHGTTQEVHLSQLKPYEDDCLLEGGVPLHHIQNNPREAPVPTPQVEFIRSHSTARGPRQFLVHWSNSKPQEDSWLSLTDLIQHAAPILQSYLSTHVIHSDLVRELASPDPISDM
jgi:hypothetical protein